MAIKVGLIGYGLAGASFHAPLIAADALLIVADALLTAANVATWRSRSGSGLKAAT